LVVVTLAACARPAPPQGAPPSSIPTLPVRPVAAVDEPQEAHCFEVAGRLGTAPLCRIGLGACQALRAEVARVIGNAVTPDPILRTARGCARTDGPLSCWGSGYGEVYCVPGVDGPLLGHYIADQTLSPALRHLGAWPGTTFAGPVGNPTWFCAHAPLGTIQCFDGEASCGAWRQRQAGKPTGEGMCWAQPWAACADGACFPNREVCKARGHAECKWVRVPGGHDPSGG
jgi:hypothetical protein